MYKALPEAPIIEVECKEKMYIELDPDEPNLGRPKSFRAAQTQTNSQRSGSKKKKSSSATRRPGS